MNILHGTLRLLLGAALLAIASEASAQSRFDWIGAADATAAWDQGDVGGGEGANWFTPGPPPANLQPLGSFNEYASISNGGTALIDHAITTSPADIRLGQDAATSGGLVIRNGGSITVNSGGAGTTGLLANGVNGTGRLTLRDNMGAVSVQRYTQNSQSTLVTQLSANGTFANRVVASSVVAIDGTLRLERTPGTNFTLATGNSWTVISGAPVTGAFDEVAIERRVRGNAGQVVTVSTASSAVTMTVEQRLVAQVDRFTGAVKLANPTGHAVNIPFINYTLSAPTGGVASGNGRWNSLADQFPTNWFEANPTATQLSELNPLSQATLNVGQSIDIGTPLNANPSAPLGTSRVNAGEVTLQYQTPTGQYLNAVVEQVGRYNDLVLVVNPTNGSALIQNQSGQNINMISYIISSPSAGLLPGYSGVGGPSWFKANPTSSNLSELNSTGVANLRVGAELALGTPWNPANAEDLTFRYQTPDGFLRNGTVHYGAKAVITASNNADFDSDGDVDGADFLKWQRGYGLAGQPNKSTGDANGDGNVNDADLAIWKTQFGTNPGPAVGAIGAVPEPATAVLALTAAAMLVSARHRTR